MVAISLVSGGVRHTDQKEPSGPPKFQAPASSAQWPLSRVSQASNAPLLHPHPQLVLEPWCLRTLPRRQIGASKVKVVSLDWGSLIQYDWCLTKRSEHSHVREDTVATWQAKNSTQMLPGMWLAGLWHSHACYVSCWFLPLGRRTLWWLWAFLGAAWSPLKCTAATGLSPGCLPSLGETPSSSTISQGFPGSALVGGAVTPSGRLHPELGPRVQLCPWHCSDFSGRAAVGSNLAPC